MTRSYRHQRKASDHRPAKEGTDPLVTHDAQVRSVGLTLHGHLACVFDTSAGRLKALSDAASVHLPELAVGRKVQVVLLRLKRVTGDATWHWQLLGCRGLAEPASNPRLTQQNVPNQAAVGAKPKELA